MRFPIDKMASLLELHEGVRHYPYQCTSGKWTIGVGINLEAGLYPEEIDFLLKNRITKLDQQLRDRLFQYREMSVVRQMVLVDMAFNLGVAGLMGFRKMRAALALNDYTLAAAEMLDSKWARQVGRRAERLAEMMRTNEWFAD